eukprot:68599-Chlamydomonas_euryale.AAC.1
MVSGPPPHTHTNTATVFPPAFPCARHSTCYADRSHLLLLLVSDELVHFGLERCSLRFPRRSAAIAALGHSLVLRLEALDLQGMGSSAGGRGVGARADAGAAPFSCARLNAVLCQVACGATSEFMRCYAGLHA